MGTMEQMVQLLEQISNKLDNMQAEDKQEENMEMMSVEETAEFMSWSESKVRTEIRKGDIPFVKYGGRYAVPKWKLVKQINSKIDKANKNNLEVI